MIHAWLSLPLPALILSLVAFYTATSLVLVRLSFGALVGPWVRSYRGVVAPYFGAIVVIFSILTGFLANDVWDRSRRAAAAVRGEGASLISLHALAAALGAPHIAIDRAIRGYATAAVYHEWPSMENGEASPEAEAAQDKLLQAVVQADTGPGNAVLDSFLLDTALKIREARGNRLALSSDLSEEFEWACVLLMAVMAQISIAAVHLDAVRAQIAAMAIFIVSVIIVIGLIAVHEIPFRPPLGISPAPLAKLLDLVPDG
ncbi:MAG: bestrophin-like domain [Beijerinckiaceae bacterium]